jgi:hypothetical protein
MDKKPSLLPQDGAIFVGSVTTVAVGSFRASCHAEHDQRHSIVMEESSAYFRPCWAPISEDRGQ